MKTVLLCMAIVVTLALIGAGLVAQEILPTPDPIGGTKPVASASADAIVPTPPRPAADATVASAANSWRYRWHDGRWWYWTSQNRWMWYANDARWVEFDASHSPPAINRGAINPPPGYASGYYPGTAVDVRPYGDVNVHVGRRVGVDVSGPHGAVRVGRLCIGW